MPVVVPAISPTHPLLEDEAALYQFLFDCQRQLQGTQRQLLSLSCPLPDLDALQVLASFDPQKTVHFYGEDRPHQQTVLAYGVVESYVFAGSADEKARFVESRRFIDSCFQRLLSIAEGVNPSPYIFSGFSFFSQPPASSPFPAAFLFLPQFQLLQQGQQWSLTCNIALDRLVDLPRLTGYVFSHCHFLHSFTKGDRAHIPGVKPAQLHSSAQRFSPYLEARRPQLQGIVTDILQRIERGELEKIVLAQNLDLQRPEGFRIEACLQRLRFYYQDCYLFSLGNGHGHCFIGASPERLLSIRNHHLQTDALAGSAPRGKNPQADQQLAQKLWQSQKERREHQVVLEFIVERLMQLGLTPHCAPLTFLKLSNIQHLWTAIQAPMLTALHPLELVAHLHPTPAVAGVPVSKACELIQHYENFDRSLYAGPLGWIDPQGNCEFRVGIRSALISEHQARLFAGAGIVRGSDPAQEIAEINLKLQALGRTLLAPAPPSAHI